MTKPDDFIQFMTQDILLEKKSIKSKADQHLKDSWFSLFRSSFLSGQDVINEKDLRSLDAAYEIDSK